MNGRDFVHQAVLSEVAARGMPLTAEDRQRLVEKAHDLVARVHLMARFDPDDTPAERARQRVQWGWTMLSSRSAWRSVREVVLDVVHDTLNRYA